MWHPNHFHLLRLVAAMAVLVSHSFPISGDPLEPLHFLGYSLGGWSVDVFFATSGYLVTGSLLRSLMATETPVWRRLFSFSLSRFLRIFPGLSVANALTILACGLFAGSIPFTEYLARPEPWQAWWANTALVIGDLHDRLPGVFLHTPLPYALNGSLWTLPYEVKLYAVLAVASLPCFWLIKRVTWTRTLLFTLCLVLALTATAKHLSLVWTEQPIVQAYRFMGLFFAGALLYLSPKKLTTPNYLFAVLTSIYLGIGLLQYLDPQPILVPIWQSLHAVSIPFLAISLAHLPGSAVQRFFGRADFSYGIYIYAFPVQQIIASMLPHPNPWTIMAWSSLLVTAIAAASWFLIEKPFMSLKVPAQAIAPGRHNANGPIHVPGR